MSGISQTISLKEQPMPNPDFTGSVPHRRCETCKYWHQSKLRSVRGLCNLGAYGLSTADSDVNVILETQAFYTTDLTVCSNWTADTGDE